MLCEELSIEEIADVRYREGREEGWEEGLEQGREEIRNEKLAIARNLFSEGMTPEFVQKITGLDLEIIKDISKSII